jgi:hypothetical protein
LFRETGPSSLDEDNIDEYEVEDDPGEQPEEDGVEEECWDHLFLEEDEDNLQSDIDMDQEN